MMHFPPSRDAAIARLNSFVPKAGRAYAAQRNYDRVGDVSALSPYIRHRVITEEQVLHAVRGAHKYTTAQKFIAEVYWRTYWKGWLEHRPAIWDHYKATRAADWNMVQTQTGLRTAWEDACAGKTGIDCFDYWARELTTTGYLHNHARMWFASIWIFTLRLPWSLGADFFMRHLLDGDPASNTLSWRWVGGLQTIGKTYLARADNIAEYTNGRFKPTGLAPFAPPLDAVPHPPLGPLPVSDPVPTQGRTGLLITEDDLSIDWVPIDAAATACLQTTNHRSHLSVSPHVIDFTTQLMTELDTRMIAPDALQRWAAEAKLDHIVTPYIPVGPTRDALMPVFRNLSIPVLQILRPYDNAAWPHATKGFFKFKDAIPRLLAGLT